MNLTWEILIFCVCRWRSLKWCGERHLLIEQEAQPTSSSDKYTLSYELSCLPNETYKRYIISKCFNIDKSRIQVHVINFGCGVRNMITNWCGFYSIWIWCLWFCFCIGQTTRDTPFGNKLCITFTVLLFFDYWAQPMVCTNLSGYSKSKAFKMESLSISSATSTLLRFWLVNMDIIYHVWSLSLGSLSANSHRTICSC